EGLGRTHVDDNGAPLCERRGERAALAFEQNLAHDRAGRQHRDDDVGAASERLERRRGAGAEFRREARSARAIAVEDRERKAAARQGRGYGPAHVADADESDSLLDLHARAPKSPSAPAAPDPRTPLDRAEASRGNAAGADAGADAGARHRSAPGP